jgi:hypothetical protein
MGKFVCVFTEKDRGAVLKAGFRPVTGDSRQICFLFIYDPSIEFDWSETDHVFTDVLCF